MKKDNQTAKESYSTVAVFQEAAETLRELVSTKDIQVAHYVEQIVDQAYKDGVIPLPFEWRENGKIHSSISLPGQARKKIKFLAAKLKMSSVDFISRLIMMHQNEVENPFE